MITGGQVCGIGFMVGIIFGGIMTGLFYDKIDSQAIPFFFAPVAFFFATYMTYYNGNKSSSPKFQRGM